MNDVTERKRLENHVRHVQKMEAIGTLAGGIAHQFNNALFAIVGNTDLMRLKAPDNEIIENYVKAVKDPVNRMSDLTDQLLAYAQEGKYRRKNISVGELVENTLNLVQHTLTPSVRIETDLREGTGSVEVDIAQMQMALAAILANATEATDGEGLIRISTRKTTPNHAFVGTPPDFEFEGYVCLSVEDKGKGMDSKTRDRMFEPFFTTKFQGRGLGMAAVYGIIKQQKGHLEVESEPGLGTSVNVYLPVTHGGKQGLEKTKHHSKMVEGDRTILVVDDEEMVLDVSAELIKKMGYSVLKAPSGLEAMKLYKQNKEEVDLVILDVIMPDMDGGETYAQLREIAPDVKVILTSGYSEDGRVFEMMRHGCIGFLQKPFSLTELSETIHELVN